MAEPSSSARRVAVLAYGTHGDVAPYLALVQALRRLGVEAQLVAPEGSAGHAAALGVPFVSLPGDPTALMRDGEARERLRAGDVMRLVAIARTQLAPVTDALAETARQACHGVDLVVGTSVTSFLAVACAAAAGARVALAELTPLTPDAVAVTSVIALADYTRFCARWGVEAEAGNPDLRARARGVPMVHGFSAHLVPRHPSWGATHLVSGAMTLGAAEQARMAGAHDDPAFAAWLADGEPPLYIGFGSLPVFDGDALSALAAETAAVLGMRVVASGASSGVAAAGTVSREVYGLGPCSHAWLFPRCAAVVHHGGAGTTHAAVLAGVPQVVCSIFSDQPFWGSLVEHHRAGAHLPFRQLTAVTLRDAVHAARRPECADAIRGLSARLAAEGGAVAAARHLTAAITA